MDEQPQILIDTDMGVDDAYALALASRFVKIRSICTTYGNVSVDQAIKNAKLFTKLYGIDAPIYRGSAGPLFKKHQDAKAIHGNDGLGDVFENNENTDTAGRDYDFYLHLPEGKHQFNLFTLGPLTNLALAIDDNRKALEPIDTVYIMGGAFGTYGHRGNVTPQAEFNFYSDPEAVKVVLESPLRLTIIPLDVTEEVLLSLDDIKGLKNELLEKISGKYFEANLSEDKLAGMAVHDALTVACALHPDYFELVPAKVSIETEGENIGKTTYKYDPRSKTKIALKGKIPEIKAFLKASLQR